MSRRLGLLAAVVIAFAGAVPVVAHDPDPTFGELYAQNKVLQYRWSASGTPPYDMKVAIHAARDDANASRKAKAPTFDFDTGATNVIYYGTDVPCGVNGLACFQRDPPGWFGVWFRENGHRFDWGTLRWCELSGAPDGCYDAENIALDELGHVLGLDHHDNFADDSDYRDAVVQTYSRTKPRSGYNAHVFGRCDVAALQQQYDVLAFTTLYSTCLDIPTVARLTASSTSVTAGAMVTFTATLTSAGTGRLSNNPVTGRTLVLQQRTSSGWSDVLTMSPTTAAGTYTASLTIRSSQDYRALFRKPANEGLRSDFSGAVSISVTAACTSLCPQSAPAPGQ
ncbi:MAG TPA: hypothetical protein VGK16_13030 [Candidatus Limnocylindrales bacterium]